MTNQIQVFAIVWLFYSLAAFILGINKSHTNKVFVTTPWGLPLGVFVFGDAVILGIFWMLASTVLIIWPNVQLLITIFSCFWLIRALGEVIYWIHEQFATTKRNKPKDLLFHQYFHGESIYFAYQLFWQVVMVVSLIIFTTYLN